MNNDTKKGRKQIFIGILITSLGVVFNAALRDKIEGLGVVFIALGGILIIAGILKKKGEKDNRDTQ